MEYYFFHIYSKQKSGVALIRHLLIFVVEIELSLVWLYLEIPSQGAVALFGTVG